jgi:hypothetical protein
MKKKKVVKCVWKRKRFRVKFELSKDKMMSKLGLRKEGIRNRLRFGRE